MASSFSRRVSSTSFRRFSGLSLAAAAGVALLFTGCKQAITDPKDLGPALKRAVERVERGEPAVVDVVTQPR